MFRLLKVGRVVAVLGLLAVVASLAQGQVINSAARPIALNATLSEGLSLSLSANAVNFALTAGKREQPGQHLDHGDDFVDAAAEPRIAVGVYAFFTSSAAALTDGAGNNIPSSAFSISNNGGAFLALVNTVPFGGANAGRLLSNTPILGNNKTGTRTDLMLFNIDLTGVPNLPGGTYTGILTIQAQAI